MNISLRNMRHKPYVISFLADTVFWEILLKHFFFTEIDLVKLFNAV